MLANELCYAQPRLDRIEQEPVLQAEREAVNPENAGSLLGLLRTDSRFRKFGGLAICEIHQQNMLPFRREFG
jgi:hypothetical protein